LEGVFFLFSGFSFFSGYGPGAGGAGVGCAPAGRVAGGLPARGYRVVFMFGSGSVGFCGSRRLPVGSGALVSRVVGQVMAGGHPVLVGCASGADALVVSAAVHIAPGQASVFCAFGRFGEGALGQVSNVAGVMAAASSGVSVQWWAGGGQSVPPRARLSRRTLSMVGAASAGLAAFFGSPSSRGTALACRHAVARSLPVAAFPLGFPGSQLPALGAGHWVPCQRGGVWSAAWHWQREKQLF